MYDADHVMDLDFLWVTEYVYECGVVAHKSFIYII